MTNEEKFNLYLEKLREFTRLSGYTEGLLTAKQVFDIIPKEMMEKISAIQLRDLMQNQLTQSIAKIVDDQERRKAELEKLMPEEAEK